MSPTTIDHGSDCQQGNPAASSRLARAHAELEAQTPYVDDREAWPWYLAPGDCVDYDEAVRHALYYGRVIEQIGGSTLAIHGRAPLTNVGVAS